MGLAHVPHGIVTRSTRLQVTLYSRGIWLVGRSKGKTATYATDGC